MSSDILQEIACPNCQNPIDIREHGRHIQCDACGSQFILNGHLCPQCSSYHHEQETFCRNCGTALARTCRRCKFSNWAGEEYCAQCGEPMDIFDLLSLQHRDVRRAMQERREAEIRELRAQEEVAARERLEALEEIEVERRQLVATRLAEQRRQERRLMFFSVTAVAVFVLVVAIYLLLSAIR